MILETGVNSQKGFTLVEVMLSVLILGLGLVVIANSYLIALRGINASQNNIQAMVLAKEKIDELEVSSVMKKGLTAFSESDTLKSLGKSYNYTLDITEIAEPEYIEKYLVKACLTFSWREQNIEKNATFSTYLPKYKEDDKETKSL